ncbi:MAG: hypothetical protein ACW98K_05900 [Candidatus Kariarchaeaceae archaeon]|jgi:hypothetical protein
MKIKHSFIFLLIGSSLFFANATVKDSVQSFLEEGEQAGINTAYDKIEIVFWTYLLYVLGASSYILVGILNNIYGSTIKEPCLLNEDRKSKYLVKLFS